MDASTPDVVTLSLVGEIDAGVALGLCDELVAAKHHAVHLQLDCVGGSTAGALLIGDACREHDAVVVDVIACQSAALAVIAGAAVRVARPAAIFGPFHRAALRVEHLAADTRLTATQLADLSAELHAADRKFVEFVADGLGLPIAAIDDLEMSEISFGADEAVERGLVHDVR